MGVSSKVSDAFSINEAGKVNEESELQLANALKPKDSTVDGSLTVFKAVQFSKVLRRMLVISQSLSNVAVSRAVQLLNTPLLMLFTEAGISTFFRASHFAKA